MTNYYPSLCRHVTLHLQPFGGLIIFPETNTTKFAKPKIIEVNKFAAAILEKCTGRNLYSDILRQLEQEYELENSDVRKQVGKYIVDRLSDGIVDLHDEPLKNLPQISGSFDFISPIHVSIELTDHCNLRCRHCYRESSSVLNNFLPSNILLRIVEEMAQNGVSTVELTGGEPTTHPDFPNILSACSKYFGLVALITNGWFLDERMVDQIASHKNIVVQINIDGPTPELHDEFRGTKGSFVRIKHAAELLRQHNVFFRLAMSVSDGNFSHIEDTAEIAHQLGASCFGVAPVLDIGRGHTLKLLSNEQIKQLCETLQELRLRYHKDFIFLPDDSRRIIYNLNKNCGAGWRSMTLSPKGYLRPCVMMNEDWFSFGNIISSSYYDVVKRGDSDFFYKLTTPNPDLCRDCCSLTFCVGCMVRPIYAMQNFIENCLTIKCHWDEYVQFSSMLKRLSNWE